MQKLLTILVLTLCATASCKAQLTEFRWGLNSDSTVTGVHYGDLVHMAAIRRLYRHQRESYKMQSVACSEQVVALDGLIKSYERENDILQKKFKMAEELTETLYADNDALTKKVNKLKPWATVGKVATFSVGLGVAGFGIAAGINAIHSR